jgi:hypothetical protein
MLLVASGLSIHAAAMRLTTAIRSNECRLWCNGCVVPPQYIATSLTVTASVEVDGRPQADIIPNHSLDPQKTYTFEFDADEVRARLLPPEARATKSSTAPKMPPAPKNWSAAKRWVYDRMCADGFPAGHGYVAKLHERCCLEHKVIDQKTISNYVSDIRRERREPPK